MTPVPGWGGEWLTQANCVGIDPEAFYSELTSHIRQAKQVCAGCEVRTACLDAAIAAKEPFGVWGGMTPRERSLEAKARRQKTR